MTASVVRVVLLGLLPVALAAGIWRVERDRPGWLVAGAVRGPAPRRRALPLAPRLVLAVHYPWYGTPDRPERALVALEPRAPRDARAGRILGFHDPRRTARPGGSTSARRTTRRGDPTTAVTRRAFGSSSAQARAAGLDGLAVSWWGHEREEALGLAALFRHAGEAGLVLAPYYETGELRRRGALGVAADLERLLDRHGSEPAWLRVGGRPWCSSTPRTSCDRRPGTPCARGSRREAGGSSSSPT